MGSFRYILFAFVVAFGITLLAMFLYPLIKNGFKHYKKVIEDTDELLDRDFEKEKKQ